MVGRLKETGVIALSCPDAPGIVHAVSGFLLKQRCNITESQQFEDPTTGRFFMRVRFSGAEGGELDLDDLRHRFEPVAASFDMDHRLVDPAQRERVVIMVSKFGHCLNDLLYRTSIGELNMDVIAVVSNHPDLAWMADSYDVPFHHIPVTSETKVEAEGKLLELVRTENVGLVVLARYMQILTEHLCRELKGQAINIHHSMLPSFKGSRPYHQAHVRGTKLVGATAHYVTSDLDEGPIIEQDVIRVDHSMAPEDLAARGREVECRALARAVRWQTESRVMLNGHKTVVFQ